MRKVVLTFGLLAGVTVSIFSIIIMRLCEGGRISLDNSDLIGYGSMVIALSMIFFGIKSYRDNYQNGAIRFGKAVQVGLLIVLVATLLFAVAAEIYYQVDPAAQAVLMDKYADHHISRLKQTGAAAIEIEQKTREMTNLKEMNKSAVIRFAMSVAIILPVGLVITLISAALLRRKDLLPA
jgi:hypothetical protein